MRYHFLAARVPAYFRSSRLRSLYPGLVLLIVLSLIIPVGEQSVYAVAAPSPLSPVDGTTTTAANYPPLGIPEFTWTSVASTNTYRIQFSQNIAFTSKVEVTTARNRSTLALQAWFLIRSVGK